MVKNMLEARRSARGGKKGFTLLELIVVIVILGILALIAIPTFLGVINKSKDATAAETASALDHDATALAAFDQAAGGPTYVQTVLNASAVPAVGSAYVDGSATELASTYTVKYVAAGSSSTVGGTFQVSSPNGGVACLVMSGLQSTSGTVTDGACPTA